MEEFPQATHFWYRDGLVLVNNAKYELRQDPVAKSIYRVKMSLTVKSVDSKDFGEYICSGKRKFIKSSDNVRCESSKENLLPKTRKIPLH